MNNNNFNNIRFDPMTGQPINQVEQQQIQNSTNMYSQPQQVVQESININQSQKKKINPKLFIIIGIILVVIILGIVFVPKIFGNKSKGNISDSLTDSTSFWLRSDEYLYAMFDIDGNQITDFEFTYADSEFFNGTALVKNNNDIDGIISSNGKMIVDFGKYDNISSKYSVYEMRDKEGNKYLYSSSGKLIRKLEEDEDIIPYIGTDTFAIIESDTEYKVIDYKGELITKIPRIDNDNVNSPEVSSEGNYVSIFYNKNNYIIDISKKKVILSFSEDRHFCINKVNENNINEVILNSCTNGYGKQDKYGFKFIRDGKIIFSRDLDEHSLMYFEGNNIILKGNYNTYVLDEKGNDALETVNKSYKDYKNYVTESDNGFGDVELYVNGQLKEKINCRSIKGDYAKHGVYLLDSCNGLGKANEIYINYDGKRINDKSYQVADEFDDNGYASVSEDLDKYYLINLKGEKVSDYYIKNISNVYGTDNLYYGTNDDGTISIFEVNGEKIVTGERIKTQISNDVVYAIIENDGKYTIYDLQKRKNVVVVNSVPSTSSNYFTTSENSKTQYYSYTTGKLFYEE